jgi:hypothetical protein
MRGFISALPAAIMRTNRMAIMTMRVRQPAEGTTGIGQAARNAHESRLPLGQSPPWRPFKLAATASCFKLARHMFDFAPNNVGVAALFISISTMLKSTDPIIKTFSSKSTEVSTSFYSSLIHCALHSAHPYRWQHAPASIGGACVEERRFP